MKLYFPPLFLLLFICSVSSSNLNGKIRDAQKLLSFKSTLPNPEILSTWGKNTDPCVFTGVSCDDVVSRVTSLNISFLPISSNLSAIVTHLFQIELLGSVTIKSANISGNLEQFSLCSDSIAGIDLAGNSITGGFYGINHFGACSNLKTLNLSSNLMGFSYEEDLSKIELLKLEVLDISLNNFSTTLPKFGENYFPNLKLLDLSSNKFYGEIGDSFLGLKKLTLLNVSHNILTGVFPESLLGSDSKLEFLNLASNKLQGEIPQSFAADSCSTLVEFDISYNNISGMIPSGFGSCNLVQILDVSYNNLSGNFPCDLFLKMGNLRKLLLGFNNFVGTLPESFSDLAKLESLDLSSNKIMGKIPSGICENPSLRELHLQNNLLDGVIPETLGNCSELVSLDLSFNYLTGKIPSSLGLLSNLKDLIMLMNKLEGEIPSELMYVRPLENLILDYNQLTGSIPFGLSNCTKLIWISLSSNMLSGEIPSWIGTLDNLAILKLGNNSFSGQIPAELGDCKSLLWLDLNSNLLSGEIPSTLAKQSGNMAVALVVGKQYVYWRNQWGKECRGTGNLLEFAGIRDNALDRLPTRDTCNFSQIYRGMTRPIFNHNGSMIFLDLSYNDLEGSIPKELGAMYYLSILNLGHNKISGPIPQDLGGLKNVGVLDFSHNNLSGQIPASLAGLTLLTDIDFSFNDLSGMIPPSGQFETFPAYRFFNNSGLCGYPLPICNGNAGANAYPHEKHRRQTSLLRSVGMGLLFSLFCIFALIIVSIEMKKRRKNQNESSMDVYRGSNGNSHSGGRNSAWRFTNHCEALSINLSTFEKPLRKLTFADLLEATNGFHDDSIIGKGGFGDVYKARLKDGNVVAIKKLIQISGQGDREFTAEMETIGKIKHRNLVPLLGYCKVGEERLLVYEYMKYGSLDDVLHNRKKGGIKLNWAARRKIALGAARGLAFLHHNCIPHIIHRDMKSSNVLVDENLEARVSDFGMARLMSAMDTHLSVSTLAGTPGYVPPEYYQSFRCSTKGDVYSFGVVLLELLTGKQPTDSADFGDNNLVGWVKQHAKLKITDVFDPELLKEDPSLEVELLQHLQVGSACLDDRPWKRPSMIDVMAMFKEIQAGGSGLHSSSTITEESEVRYGGMGGSFSTVEMLDLSIKEGNLKE